MQNYHTGLRGLGFGVRGGYHRLSRCWYNTNQVEALLTNDRTKAKLNRCLNEGAIIYSKHFRAELANDDPTTEDILAVCRFGAMIMAPEKDIKTGQWKYRIEGITVDRRLSWQCSSLSLRGLHE